MANILGIFTAIILAVAAFVAVKNNARMEQEIVSRATEEKKLAQSQELLKTAMTEIKALSMKRAEADAEFVAKTEEEAALRESIDKMKADIKDKGEQAESNKESLNEFREKVAKVGSIRDLATDMKSMITEIEEITQGIDEKKTTLANLTASVTASELKAKKLKEELDRFSRGESLPSLKTSIRGVYPTWGFVTLNAGNNAGITSSSILEVVRDGSTIAKLLVTSVESSSASANIIPDSITHGSDVMVGDRVVTVSKSKATADN